MITLASGSVGELFTIPVSEWTQINKRVGQVLATAPIKDYMATVLSGYPALLESCIRWQNSTFSGLISNSQILCNYCAVAISDFSGLNAQVKEVVQSGSQNLPDSLKQETIILLQKLNKDTSPVAAQSNLLSAEVLAFLNCNVTVDAQMALFKDSLGTFWNPLGDTIKNLEAAAGHVTGVWSAITDDLNYTLGLAITVTIPFIESLNIDVAIASWQNVQAEAVGFPAMTVGQEQYWMNPF